MNLPDADQDFLRDLVKVSRQRPQHVRWVDRDGTDRITTLSAADAARIDTLSRQLHTNRGALMVLAAQLPTKRPPRPDSPAPSATP